MDEQPTLSSSHIVERSLARIEVSDLQRLTEFAKQDHEGFFNRYPRWRRLYADRWFCVALCQGAALHYLDGQTGVKDFDVWTFYTRHPEAPFPFRRRACRDFGPSRFGRHPAELEYTGRRVDFLGRSVLCPLGADPVVTLQTYLSENHSQTERLLAEKAVVALEPAHLFGYVIWPMTPGLPSQARHRVLTAGRGD
jgi:hypothetical protein